MPFCREALLIHVCRKVVFANGVRKVSMPDGSTVIHFTNGDLKEATADGKCDSIHPFVLTQYCRTYLRPYR